MYAYPRKRRVLYAGGWWLEDLMVRVAHHAVAHGWHLDLQMVLTRELPERWTGDGILTTLSGDPERMSMFLKHATCPVVSLNLNYPDISVPRVGIDLEQVGHLAAEHFTEKGFRHLAVYSAAQRHTSELAIAAIRKDFKVSNHTFVELFWPKDRGNKENRWVNRQVWLRKKLHQLTKPLAVFCYDQLCAIEVVEACLAEEISLPDEVAILMLHGTLIFRECTTVALSSIDINYDAQAKAACELLERLMTGGSVPPHPILIPPKGLTVRASTDTLAATSRPVARAIRFMLDHFAESISVDEATVPSGLCRTSLFREFQKEFRQSPHEVLTRIRVERAKRVLKESDAKISTVAETCGFTTSKNLQRNFMRYEGTSPGAYRSRHQTHS